MYVYYVYVGLAAKVPPHETVRELIDFQVELFDIDKKEGTLTELCRKVLSALALYVCFRVVCKGSQGLPPNANVFTNTTWGIRG